MAHSPEFIQTIVISTRIRLARNFASYPFPQKMDDAQAEDVVYLVGHGLKEFDSVDTFTKYDIKNLTKLEAMQLQEEYLISPALQESAFGAAFVSKDRAISIMVNEEDHLREQYYTKGFQLYKAYEYLSGIDDVIGDCVKLAYDDKLGYLTACPTNLGTGLRASVMLFLPAMTRRGMMRELMEQMRRKGMTVRGVYGEGSTAEGYMYQISNEITLGPSEQEILEVVYAAVYTIAETEVRARKEMYEVDPVGLRDVCGRAYGVLANCARLDNAEFLRLIADLKMGVSLGIYEVNKMSELDDLIIGMRDSNIMRFFTGRLTKEELCVYRAEYVQKRLKEILGNG